MVMPDAQASMTCSDTITTTSSITSSTPQPTTGPQWPPPWGQFQALISKWDENDSGIRGNMRWKKRQNVRPAPRDHVETLFRRMRLPPSWFCRHYVSY